LNHKKKKPSKIRCCEFATLFKSAKKQTTIGLTNINDAPTYSPSKKNLTVEKSSALLRKKLFSLKKKKQQKHTKWKSTSSELLSAKINIYVARI